MADLKDRAGKIQDESEASYSTRKQLKNPNNAGMLKEHKSQPERATKNKCT